MITGCGNDNKNTEGSKKLDKKNQNNLLNKESKTKKRDSSLLNKDLVKKRKNNDSNILLITIDTLRFDRISFYSDKYVKTPNIDKLSKRSIVFERAFAHNPLTLPSHINILTGTYPLYHGISDNTHYKLDNKFLTLSELLKSTNYNTAAFIGAFPLDSRFGLNQGFDLYDENYGSKKDSGFLYIERRADKVIDPAMKWISKQRKKWFAWIHLFDPHQPYSPPSPFKEEYKNDLYSGEVAYIDAQLGLLFDFLKKGEMKNTIIIITSDHGEALGEKGEKTHGYFAYNNTIHVPLIIYLPGLESKVLKENVGHIDIFPTICEYIGVPIPKHIQGKSLIPLISGKKQEGRRIYFESLSPYLNIGWAPLYGFIEGGLKYIDQPIPEVYDLEKDLSELTNIAGNYKIKKFKKDLRKLKRDNKNRNRSFGSNKLDSKTKKKIESLGYISGGNSVETKRVYKKEDDLKILAPLYNKTVTAVAYFQSGDLIRSKKMLSEIIQTKPSFILPYKNLAIILEKQGKIKESISILESGLKIKPDNFELLSKLGILKIKIGELKSGIEVLKGCLKIEDFNPDIYNHLGIGYFKLEKLDLALDNYNKAIKIDSDNSAFLLNRGILYLTRYYIKKTGLSLAGAIADLKKVTVLEPKKVNSYLLLSTAYKKNNEIDKAIDCLKKGLLININNGSLLAELGIAYLDKGENKIALNYFYKLKKIYFSKMSKKNRAQIQSLINRALQN